MKKIDAKSTSYKELEKIIIKNKLEKYRATQIFKWIHSKLIDSFDQMSNLSIKDRGRLKNIFYINNIKIKEKLISKHDKTVKYLFELEDGEIIESVVMDYGNKKSICISTEVGCKMGCSFCASSKLGFVRQLTAGEMLDQVYKAQIDLKTTISNVVLMGIGEPLDNYQSVCKFLEIINDEKGLGISLRKITLSSCGICDMINEMATQKLGVTLSISLHASNDIVRNKLMPINKTYNINKILESCENYIKSTNRRITFEYVCIDGVNDSKKDATLLSKKIKQMLCHVNLIWLNPIEGQQYKTSKKNIENFRDVLIKNGINTTIRRRLGIDLNAACGQLRRDKTEIKTVNGG